MTIVSATDALDPVDLPVSDDEVIDLISPRIEAHRRIDALATKARDWAEMNREASSAAHRAIEEYLSSGQLEAHRLMAKIVLAVDGMQPHFNGNGMACAEMRTIQADLFELIGGILSAARHLAHLRHP